MIPQAASTKKRPEVTGGALRDQVRNRPSGVKFFVVDVDGTLTDGGMYYGRYGETLKRFDTRDAFGMNLLRRQGLTLVMITGENSPIALARARKLEIKHMFAGVTDKRAVLEDFLRKRRARWEDVCYVGDDLNDLCAMQLAGFSACPADASETVKSAARYVCHTAGGRGAVREVCDVILRGAARHVAAGTRRFLSGRSSPRTRPGRQARGRRRSSRRRRQESESP
jgi:N-acylneuraminate cytidylyltransferase